MGQQKGISDNWMLSTRFSVDISVPLGYLIQYNTEFT